MAEGSGSKAGPRPQRNDGTFHRFVKPPKVPLRLYLLYGMTMAVGQFALLFTAIHIGMPSVNYGIKTHTLHIS